MALDNSAFISEASAEVEVHHGPEADTTPETSIVNFQKGAGPSSFFYLGDNKEAKISKSKLAECIKVMGKHPEEKYEDYLSVLLPDALQRECEKHGLNLLSLFIALKAKFEGISTEFGLANEINDAVGLATLLSMIAPALSAQELSEKLKALCDAHLEEAVVYLDNCEKQNGRNKPGYIYMRKQDPTKLANRKKSC